ncbi:MAG TPA: hypothetical protein VLX68_08265 [Chitinivibrionales bacterium]|nr:hypothetical protein [Chitinivibrionales bacterium]
MSKLSRPCIVSSAAMVLLILVASGFAAGGSERIVVTNNCPITLWIHFTEMPYTADINGGKAQKMLPNTAIVYDSLPDFGAGRCWAYYKDPGTVVNKYAPISSCNGFVEMTVSGGPAGVQNYNISFVDYATLPVKVVGGSKNCIPTIVPVSFAEMQRQLKTGCPTQLADYIDSLGIGRCLSSYFYCVQPGYDTGNIYCNKMKLAYGYSGLAIYGGSFGGAPQSFYDSVAGWNRGTLAGDADSSDYYIGPETLNGEWYRPYNHFAKWVHKDLDAEVYAFANDDHQNQSGFQACPNCGELDITWCPCENESALQRNFTPILRLQSEKFMRYAVIRPDGRCIRSGIAASVEEVGSALRYGLPQGVYYLALYGRAGDLAAKKKILVTR